MLKRACFLAVLLASPAAAADLPSGEYAGHGDGTRMLMTIAGSSARVSIGHDACLGEIEGTVASVGDNRWTITGDDPSLPCTLTLERAADGAIVIDEGAGCSAWHGMSCGFSGSVKQVK